LRVAAGRRRWHLPGRRRAARARRPRERLTRRGLDPELPGPVQGTHPEAEAACAHLGGLADPFAPLPDDVVCTEQFGGPQTARVTGRWGGAAVDLELSRADGCLIAQWDGPGPLLPIPVGVDAVG
jgi:hypothetical protein